MKSHSFDPLRRIAAFAILFLPLLSGCVTDMLWRAGDPDESGTPRLRSERIEGRAVLDSERGHLLRTDDRAILESVPGWSSSEGPLILEIAPRYTSGIGRLIGQIPAGESADLEIAIGAGPEPEPGVDPPERRASVYVPVEVVLHGSSADPQFLAQVRRAGGSIEAGPEGEDSTWQIRESGFRRLDVDEAPADRSPVSPEIRLLITADSWNLAGSGASMFWKIVGTPFAFSIDLALIAAHAGLTGMIRSGL